MVLGTHPDSAEFDQSEAFVARRQLEYLKSGEVTDFFDAVVKLEEEKNIITLKKLYVYIYSESFCVVGITALGLTNPEMKTLDPDGITGNLGVNIKEFGERAFYFKSGIKSFFLEISPGSWNDNLSETEKLAKVFEARRNMDRIILMVIPNPSTELTDLVLDDCQGKPISSIKPFLENLVNVFG